MVEAAEVGSGVVGVVAKVEGLAFHRPVLLWGHRGRGRVGVACLSTSRNVIAQAIHAVHVPIL